MIVVGWNVCENNGYLDSCDSNREHIYISVIEFSMLLHSLTNHKITNPGFDDNNEKCPAFHRQGSFPNS
jgi:hypothetical protein